VSVHASTGVGGEEACKNLLTDDAREHLRDFSSLEIIETGIKTLKRMKIKIGTTVLKDHFGL
jgi:hypothetical protein